MPLAFSPDGKSLAFGVNKTISVCETATGKTQASFDAGGFPFELIFTPDGTRLAWNDYRGEVRVWDLATKKMMHALDSFFGYGSSLAISPDGKTLAMGGGEATPCLWDLATGEWLFTQHQGHDTRVNDQVFSPDGKTLVTTGHRQTCLWDTSTWKMLIRLPWGSRTVSFSPDGRRLATIDVRPGGLHSSAVRVVDMPTFERVREITSLEVVNFESAIYADDGRTIHTLDFWPKDAPDKAFVRQWHAHTGTQTERLPIPRAFATLAPNGKTVVAALTHADGGNVMMFDLRLGRKRLIGPANGELSYRPALSPDTRHVAFAFAKRKDNWWEPVKDTRICEVATGKEILSLKGHQTDNITFGWSPDGRILATGTARAGFEGPAPEQTIRLWDTATGRALKTYDGINADAAVLTFAPSGKTLVAGLRDGTLLVFDVSKVNPRPQAAPPVSDNDFEAYWSDLASDDAVQANKSAWRLADAAAKSAPFLHERLKPAPVADAAKVQKWIADLDSEKFTVRQAAAQQLEKLDGQVQAAIQKTLRGNISLESRRRLEQMLDRQFSAPSSETLRIIRAVMVLERIGRVEAEKVLEKLAKGAPGARETEEARASLRRLKARALP
jgi:WD40 repeat protein